MRKTLTTALAVATIAVSVATFATEASAGRRGGAVAAGVAAGIIGGAIVGSAIANSRPAYVDPGPVYAAPPRYCIVDQEVWSNRHQAWVVRPTRVPC